MAISAFRGRKERWLAIADKAKHHRFCAHLFRAEMRLELIRSQEEIVEKKELKKLVWQLFPQLGL